MISMKEIAGMCGVTEATVSNALNGKSGVGRKTRERILSVAESHNYVANALVKGIQQGFTKTIGMVVFLEYENLFSAKLMKGVDRVLADNGYNAVIARTFSGPEKDREAKMVRNFAERRMDGLLVIAKRYDGGAFWDELRRFPRPVVLMDQPDPSGEFDFVGSDDFPGAGVATEHVLSLGHTELAFMGNLKVSTGASRLDGFLNALSKKGVKSRDEWIIDVDGRDPRMVALELLRSPRRPTAVVCYNDPFALAVCAAADDLGISVPRDLSVTGFANLPIASQTRPALTTVDQHAEEIGALGADLLLRRVVAYRNSKGAPIGGEPEKTLVPTDLIVRETTAPVSN
jgi:DNA-binding LacI/PurR family transcriptional regulator